jgi:hypothetical protein
VGAYGVVCSRELLEALITYQQASFDAGAENLLFVAKASLSPDSQLD